MKIMGLDQSLTETGYYIDGNNYGLIKSKNKGVERLKDIRDELEGIILNNGIDTTVMEGYAFSKTFNREFLGELGGVIKLLINDLGLKMVIIQPTLLKKFISGSGNCKKNIIILEVYKRYNFSATNDNIADAFSLKQIYVEYLAWKSGEKFNKLKTECFKKMDG